MKKIFIILFILILSAFAVVYGVLFTSSGNKFIANYIENKVNDEVNNVELKVNKLELTFDKLDFNATINDNSNINISGGLELFKKRVNLEYDIKINELAKLEKLIGKKLNGPFSTSGTFIGNEKSAAIKGISDFANSDTKYNVSLIDFEPSNIKFTSKDIKLEKLLYMLNEPNYARGNLLLRGNIKDANFENLDGYITAIISKGKLNNQVFNKEFSQNLQSRVYFKSDIRAKLLPNTAQIKSNLITSLADIFTEKTIVDLKSNTITSDYKVDVKNLSNLHSMIGQKLNGTFSTQGNLKIDGSNIKVNGMSDLLDSKTTYIINKNAKATKLDFSVKNAKVDKLLHTINEPVYAMGSLNIDGTIDNLSAQTLSGDIRTTIENGKVVRPVVNTVYKKNLKKDITFTLDANSKLNSQNILTKLTIDSNLAMLSARELVFKLKDASLNSDYKLQIPKLEKLTDLTAAKMRGAVDLDGRFTLKSKALNVTGKSNILGGIFDFNLKNDDLNANLKNFEIKELTHMFYYPKVFDSKGNMNLVYNLLHKKGKLKSKLVNGHFLETDLSRLLKQFSKFDLTKEIYSNVDINSSIDKNILSSTLNMQSKNTKIDLTRSILDLEKSTIDARLEAQIRKDTFAVKVRGNTKNPKVSLDAKNLIKRQIDKQLDKNKDKIKKKLDKVLKGKLGDDGAEEIIKGIKNLF